MVLLTHKGESFCTNYENQDNSSGEGPPLGGDILWRLGIKTNCQSAVCWDSHVYQVDTEPIGVRILSSHASGPWAFCFFFLMVTTWGKWHRAQATQWIRVCDAYSFIYGNNCFGCNLKLFYYIISMYGYGIVYLHVCLCFYAVVCVWTSMSYFGLGSLLQCETWRSNSGGQIWSQRA